MNWRKLSLLFYPVLMVAVLIADFGDPKQWNEFELGPIRLDLVIHLILFIPWAFMARRWWALSFQTGPLSSFMVLMAIGIFLAVGLEAAQYFLSYRVFSWEDMAFNLLGLGVGFLFRCLESLGSR